MDLLFYIIYPLVVISIAVGLPFLTWRNLARLRPRKAFSLRALFFLVTIACAIIGPLSNSAYKRYVSAQQAAEAARKAAEYDRIMRSRPILGFDDSNY